MTIFGDRTFEELIKVGGSVVKNLPAVQEMCIRSLVWENPLEEGMAAHSSILAWRIHMDRGNWQATVHVVTKNQTTVHTQTQTHTQHLYLWSY